MTASEMLIQAVIERLQAELELTRWNEQELSQMLAEMRLDLLAKTQEAALLRRICERQSLELGKALGKVAELEETRAA